MTITRSWRGHVFIAATLDGFIARLDGDIDWLTDPPSNQGHAPGHDGPNPPPDYQALMDAVDHLVMGRGTYEKVLTFDSWPYAKPVIVLSTTLAEEGDGRVTVARDIPQTVELLGARGSEGVYVDGGKVIQGFLEHDLIDEITLTHAPALLGHGLPLFGSLSRDIRLTHTGTLTTDAGMVSSHYLVQR